MINVNEYFEGNVKSLAFENNAGEKVSTGVIAKGEYEFGTEAAERMVISHGSARVKVLGCSDWQTYSATESFDVDANSSFKISCTDAVTYVCYYL